MYTLMVVIFIFGYLGIALEHNIKVDKAASALITGALTWVILVFGASDIFDVNYGWSVSEFLSHSGEMAKNLKSYIESIAISDIKDEGVKELTNSFIVSELQHHLIEISEILFFLIGAMTIVEVIDTHDGFKVITGKIKTVNKVKLIWILSALTFFFSAALDNLTASIVMATLLKKLIGDKKDLWLFAGIVIIAANAGGAWSPIGDVTTIMLWIGGQVTAFNIIKVLILPSIIAITVPLIILSFTMKGEQISRPEHYGDENGDLTTAREKNTIFILGVLCLVQVPVFKTVTNMPPFMGVLLGLGVLWLYTELMHRRKPSKLKSKLSVVYTLRRIDTPSVLFFLGILIAVASLQTAGHLLELANVLENKIGNMYAINIIIGLLSAVVDNVPLVAAAMGMYEIGPVGTGLAYPTDHPFWEFLAYCAGTGGSCLIIGSAAGVAVMGILRVDFVWYLKKISLLALAGYLAGAGAFYLLINIVM